MDDKLFIQSLKTNDLDGIKKVPKVNLHSHADLDGSLDNLRAMSGKNLVGPPMHFPGFSDFEEYIFDVLHELNFSKKGWLMAKANTIASAAEDGITILETSFHNGLKTIDYDVDLAKKMIDDACKGKVKVLPGIGIKNSDDIGLVSEIVDKNIVTGFFYFLDLYGDEKDLDPGKYKDIFSKAKKAGLMLKAHIGEYDSRPDMVINTVKDLQLDEVQHGITAVESSDAIESLAKQKIKVNVCPSSNLALGFVDDIKKHPIREMYDAGVLVTVNTDDRLIFNKSLSEEFLCLYNSGLFSAEELNVIRKNAFNTDY